MADAPIVVQRVFKAPPALVWALLADTNRYDRALGMSLPRYDWQDVEGTRQLVGEAAQGGMKMRWVEPPYQWVEGRFLRGERKFLSGPAQSGGLQVDVEPTEQGTRATVTAFGETAALVLKLLGPVVRAGLKRRIKAYMDETAGLLDTFQIGDDDGPPVSAVHQALLERGGGGRADGPRTAVDEAELERRARRLADAPVDADARRRLVQALADRSDDEVAQMRPFEFARAWGLDRRAVLRAFLHGTQAGLVDLNWQVNCPVCKVSAGVVDRLDKVENQLHCEACNIRYDLDFGEHVEAVFRCNRALRPVEPAVYCAASPAFRPHVLAQLRADPEGAGRHRIALHDGQLHVRTLAGQRSASLEQDHAPATLRIEVTPDAITMVGVGRADGDTAIELRTTTAEPQYISLERGGWSAEVVLGSVITSMPDFIDLFATEAPAAGLELSIGHLTLLFSDLTGSTALYERIGDARAYAVVQEHFHEMEAVIVGYGGAVVKTMGDAVMATFDSPVEAIRAARDVIANSAQRCAELQIGIKLGVHEGPCLAVRANDRLDFFGTTVNVAARLQGQAKSGELVVTEEVSELPAVAETLAGAPVRSFQASLKGIRVAQRLRSFDLAKLGRASGAPPDKTG